MGVPNVPGVPPLQDGFASDTPKTALNGDGESVSQAASLAPWGLYKDGEPVVLADSVIAFGYKQSWSLSTYPQEQGAFQTYNKVNLPFDARFRFSTGGSQADRTTFLESIDAAANSMDLFDLVTPEMVYQSVNVNDYEYDRRNSTGLGLLFVDVTCEQIRQTATAAFSNTATPSGASAADDGTIQPVPVTPGVKGQVTPHLVTSGNNGGGGW